MQTFILIMTIAHLGSMIPSAVSINSIEFQAEDVCQQAGAAWIASLEKSARVSASYICVKSGRTLGRVD